MGQTGSHWPRLKSLLLIQLGPQDGGLNRQQSQLLQRGFVINLPVFVWADRPEASMARLGLAAQAVSALTMTFVCTAGAHAQITGKPPFWAYTYNPPDFKPPPDDGQPRHVPDSTASYTVPQTRDRFLAPDWHPGDHPAMPAVVASGRQPDVYACGFCHRASGTGGRRTLTSPACRSHVLFSRYRTIGAANARQHCPTAFPKHG